MCGSLFGKTKTPEVQKVDPTVTDVTSSNISSDSGEIESIKKKKKQQGYAATQLSTILGNAGTKETLG
jgi:hypothetical protein